MNLVEANRSETQLIDTRFEHVDLSGADLTRAQAERTEFHDVRARDITVTEADMTGAIWRHWMRWDCEVVRRPIDMMSMDRLDLDPATLPETFGQRGTLSADSALDDQAGWAGQRGHDCPRAWRRVFTCASRRMAARWCRIPSMHAEALGG